MIWSFPAGLFGFTALIPLVLLHMRRNRRRELYVSSLLLWDFAGEKRESPLHQRIRESIHLLLQILIITALVLASANPLVFLSGTPPGDRIIIVLDGSASMTAEEGESTRFSHAIEEAEKVIRRRGGRETAIILAGPEPEILSGFTDSTRQLEEALNLARPVAGEADMDAGFTLAALLAEEGEAEIVLISDGGFISPPAASSLPVTFLPVGEESKNNLGITGFNARRDPEIRSRHHIFSAVKNSSAREVSTVITLSLENQVVASREITIPAGLEVQEVFPLDADSGRLELTISGDDEFPMDDRAYLVIQNTRPLKVLLVSEGNYYLETLLNVMEGLEVSVLDRFLYEAVFDIVIFDGVPPGTLPPGNYVFLGAPPSGFPVELGDPVDFPGADRWESGHPLMAGVDPRNFTVYRAPESRPLPGGQATVVLQGEVPLIYAYDDRVVRAVFFTFPLGVSDLPLRTAFPLLLNNTLGWLHSGYNPLPYDSRPGGRLITISDQGVPGRLSVAAGGEETVILIKPDGSREELALVDRIVRFYPEETGFYSLTLGGREQIRAVNLLSAEESDLTRRFEPAGTPRAPGILTDESIVDRNGTQQDEADFIQTWPWLLLLSGLLLISERILALRGLPGSGRRGRPELILTAAAGALILGAGLNPVLPLGGKSLSVIYLMDTSFSISPESRDAGLEWIKISGSAAGPIETTALITFGSDSQISSPPAQELIDPQVEILPDGRGTNPSNAFRRALSILPGTGDRRIILLSDGNETEGDLLENLSSVNRYGLTMHALPLGDSSYGNELLIRSLTGPDHTASSEAFTITLEAESLGPASGELFFYLDGEYYGEDRVELTAGTNQFAYNFRLEEHGYHQIEAVIYSESDHWYENNRYQKIVFVQGQPSLLYLFGSQGPAESLLTILENQGYRPDTRPVHDFPPDLAALFSYQSVILDNVSAFELTFTEMDLLKKAAAGGLGILVTGGDSSFGLGGYYKTPLENFLPVDVDITSSMDLPDMVILMIIDKSGTMMETAGEDDRGEARIRIDLAKQAILSAVRVMEPNHQAGILAFDADWEWTLPFIDAGDLDSIMNRISTLRPGGGTVLYPALEEARRALNAHPAAVKHIIILSDGHTDQRDFESLARGTKDDGITISTVAVGSGSDRTLMEDLARWGEGRSYYAGEIQSVPAIFADESLKASKRLTVEETFFPMAVSNHPVLSGIENDYIPPLEGFLLSYLKPEAEVILEGVNGHPLLAVKQYGLGRTAAFTSSLDSDWTIHWSDWQDYPLLFSQLMRWLSRGKPDHSITFKLSRSNRGGEITVDARIPGEGYINNLSLYAQIITPGLKEIQIPVNQTGPGRYRGHFPLNREGNYFVTIVKKEKTAAVTDTAGENPFEPQPPSGTSGQVSGTGVFSLPYPDEFRKLHPSEGFLEKAALLTGGSVLSPEKPLEAEFFVPDPNLPSNPFLLRPFLILAGLILFLTALFARLLPSDFFHPVINMFRKLLNRQSGPGDEESYRELMDRMEAEKRRENDPGHDEDFWFGRDENSG